MQEMTLNRDEKLHSIKIERNSRGVNWEIKLYYAEIEEGESIISRLKEIDEQLKKEFNR